MHTEAFSGVDRQVAGGLQCERLF